MINPQREVTQNLKGFQIKVQDIYKSSTLSSAKYITYNYPLTSFE